MDKTIFTGQSFSSQKKQKPYHFYMLLISIIAAMGENRAIGNERQLPWPEPIPADWKNLKEVTEGKKMIMGRKSYDDPHRISSDAGNFVITRQKDYQVEENFTVVHSLKEALDLCKDENEVYILGGQEIFEQAIPLAEKMVLTYVHETFKGDAFFPEFPARDFVETDRIEVAKGDDSPYDLTIITYLRNIIL